MALSGKGLCVKWPLPPAGRKRVSPGPGSCAVAYLPQLFSDEDGAIVLFFSV